MDGKDSLKLSMNKLAKTNQGIAKSSSVNLLPIRQSKDLLDAPLVCQQIQAHGEEPVRVSIAKALIKCADSLGVEMPPSRLEVITDDLLELYNKDSIEDIVLALKNGRQGRYGKVYGRLNMEAIGFWMSQVLNEKAEAREKELSKFKEETEPLEDVDYEAYKERTGKESSKNANDEAYGKFKAAYQSNKLRTDNPGNADSEGDRVPPESLGPDQDTKTDAPQVQGGPDKMDSRKTTIQK